MRSPSVATCRFWQHSPQISSSAARVSSSSSRSIEISRNIRSLREITLLTLGYPKRVEPRHHDSQNPPGSVSCRLFSRIRPSWISHGGRTSPSGRHRLWPRQHCRRFHTWSPGGGGRSDGWLRFNQRQHHSSSRGSVVPASAAPRKGVGGDVIASAANGFQNTEHNRRI